VRGCSSPLARHDRIFLCATGHAFDVARTGYVNLLQPQDRRSASAGDSKAVVQARAALLASGVGLALIDAVIDQVTALDLGEDAVVVDLGSGSGDTLAALAERRRITGIGIDLSTEAVRHAAHRFPALTWVVANADRRLPLIDDGVDVVLSLYGRRNPAECARVLNDEGILVVALPAPDDLIQLRTLVQGEGMERDRSETLRAEHEPFFTLVERLQVRDTRDLDHESLVRLLRSTYRGARLKTAARAEALAHLVVTLSAEIVVLRRRRNT